MMQLALVQGFEMGTHMIPFYVTSPLCWLFWLVFLLGMGIQSLLLRPKRKKATAWVLTVILLFGMLCCEIGCLVITGWDLLLPVMLYFYLLAMLLGAGVCALVMKLRKR